jgi:predicted ATPase
LLLRRVEDLSPEVRRVLEAASAVGEAFAVAVVAASLACPVEDVEAQCAALAAQHHLLEDTGLTFWPDGTRGGSYRFRHTLYQQVLYDELGSTRRGQLHQRIGGRLEAGYGVRAGELAAQLAVHFERGGEIPRAVHYWQQMGENAARRNAYPEATTALRKGLALLATLPDSPERTRHELTLRLILGELLMAARGMASPDAGDVYTRAHALCHQVEDTPLHFRVLWGLFVFHTPQARLRQGEALSQQLFTLAQGQHDPALLLEGHLAMGIVAFFRGDLVVSRAHLEQGLEVSATTPPSTPIFVSGYHPRVAGLTWILRPLWGLGYVDQALQRGQEVLALAQQMGHTPSLAYAEFSAALLSQCRRDVASTQAHAEALMALADAQGFGLRLEQGRMLRGWALAMRTDAAAGVAHICQGLAASHGAGPDILRPYALALLAEAYGQAGQPEAGLTVLAEALTLVATMEARWWEAELYRLKGELLLQLPLPDVPQADTCFQQALDVARRQQAKALELRAALSLGRLWQQQDKRDQARRLLTEIYGWFTEGFETPDLQEARVWIETR